jgi:hypothetical protein
MPLPADHDELIHDVGRNSPFVIACCKTTDGFGHLKDRNGFLKGWIELWMRDQLR